MSARSARPARRQRSAGAPGATLTLHAPVDRPDPGRAARAVAGGLAVLVVAGAAAMALGPHRIGDYFTETDFYGAYAAGARLVQAGRLDPSRYGVVGPVYEVVLGLVGFAFRDLFLAAQAISALASAGTLLLLFALLRRRLDARTGAFATLFLVTNPFFFRYAWAASTDALAVSLQMACVFVLATRASMRSALAAGLLGALAFLTRYSAVALLPAGLLTIALGLGRHAARRRAALAFLGGFLAPIVPWVLFSLAHGGTLALQLHHNVAYEVFARSQGLTWDEYQAKLQPQFHSLADVIARDPAAVATRMLGNVGTHLAQDARDLLGIPVAVAVAIGALLALRGGARRALAPLGLVWAFSFLALVPAFYSERYALALLPAYAAAAAWCFASPVAALGVGRPPRVRWLKPAVAVVPLASAAVASTGLQARAIDQLPVEALAAARTLAGERRPGDAVIARKPHVAFHAGVRALPIPFARTLPELARYARSQGARWLFFSWPEAETRPAFWYLLDTTAVVPGLAARAVSSGHPAVLYEIGPGFGAEPAWLADSLARDLHVMRARVAVSPDDPDLLFALAVAARRAERLPEARAALERLVTRRPGDVAGFLALGEVALAMEDAAAAEVAYARAAALDPANAEAQIGLGWASLVARRPEEAAARWRPVVEATRDPATLRRMMELFRALGDAAAAEAAARALERFGGRP